MSDGWFIWRTIADSGGDAHSDSGVMPVAASPERALPRIFTPSFSSAFSNACAAKRAGLDWKYGLDWPVRPWLKDSALSGPTSLVSRKPDEGTPRKRVERRLVADHPAR